MVRTRSQAEGTRENPIDITSLVPCKRRLLTEPPSCSGRQKPLDAVSRDALAVPTATALADYCSKDRFHGLLQRRGFSEKDALTAFECVEADGKIPSTERAKVWLKGALSRGFENLGEKIVSSDIIKDSTLQDMLEFTALKSSKVFEILLVRENARGLRDQVRFASNLSRCLHVVCTYDRPHALLASILSIIQSVSNNHRDGISVAIWNVRNALLDACSKEKALIVLQLIDVSFWEQLKASYIYSNVSLRKKLDALQLSDELKTRLKYLQL